MHQSWVAEAFVCDVGKYKCFIPEDSRSVIETILSHAD
jgi:hypothetical protein